MCWGACHITIALFHITYIICVNALIGQLARASLKLKLSDTL